MSLPILYSFRRCPYAMRARMALRYAEIDLEHREIALKDKPLAMLAASAKGTVPVLVLADDVVDQSIDIMQWALAQSDTDHWLTHNLTHELIQNNDGVFKHNLDRYKYFERYPEQSQQSYLDQCKVFLKTLETSLTTDRLVDESLPEGNGNFFLLSPKTTVLDIAIFPFVRQLAFVNKPVFDNLDLPKLKVWLDYFLNTSLFLEVMEKQPLWQADLA